MYSRSLFSKLRIPGVPGPGPMGESKDQHISSRFLNLVSSSFGAFWGGFEFSRDGGKDRVRVIDRDRDDGGVVDLELGLEPEEPDKLATHTIPKNDTHCPIPV